MLERESPRRVYGRGGWRPPRRRAVTLIPGFSSWAGPWAGARRSAPPLPASWAWPCMRSEPLWPSSPSVLRAWTRLAGGREPWRSMPLDDRAGRLGRVLEALLASDEGDATQRRRRIESASAAHGAFRAAQQAADATVARDFVLLRRAVRSLYADGVSYLLAIDALRGLLLDMRSAQRAAVRACRRTNRWLVDE